MSEIVYTSESMRQLLQLAERYASSSATVLIQGESGTGKELLAGFIHERSPRSNSPCIRINCSAFNEQLVDSMLFGHERGAFTGAEAQRPGCFEAAQDGTLFMDEIGELSLPIQARLLRVLEEKEFHRVGSFEMQPMKARVIAATNRDLTKAVAQGTFREDLLYRLDVLNLYVPPLRERPDDIPLLASHFLIQCWQEDPRRLLPNISAGAIEMLKQHDWPGNARQLRNTVQRAFLKCDAANLEGVDVRERRVVSPEEVVLPPVFETLPLKDIERLIIQSRLRKFQGSKTQAAATLQVTPRTLRNKIAAWDSVDAECEQNAA